MTGSQMAGTAAALAVAIGFGYYHFYGPVSEADKARWGGQCERWISREYHDGGPTRIVDSWKKPNRLVFIILLSPTPGRDQSSSTILPCVVDKSSNLMIKPSLFDTSWQR